MQFNTLTLGSLLALSGFAASQVVVTITSTVTYVPPTTSTVTKVVTVTKQSTTYTSVSKTTHTWGGGWPPGGGATTIYTTIYPSSTTQPPDPNVTKCPAPLYYQCGGGGWKGCNRCEKGSVCQSQNEFYYQCVAPTSTSSKE